MSGPAIYRYFASRDDLLTTLVVDAYGDLADTLGQALEQTRRRHPEATEAEVEALLSAWLRERPAAPQGDAEGVSSDRFS